MAAVNISDRKLAYSLFALRVTVFLVMLMWTLDKFVNPEHAAAVFSQFYGLSGMGHSVLMVIAGLELIIILAFLLGVYKRFSYGAVLLFHAVSTLSSFNQYLAPWENLLFFAAWPMLAACLTLYLMREADTFLTLK